MVAVHKPSGIGLISDERLRQVLEEEFTPTSDQKWSKRELVASACMLLGHTEQEESYPEVAYEIDKKHADDSYERRLAIAGALIAAEIDRVLWEKEVVSLSQEKGADVWLWIQCEQEHIVEGEAALLENDILWREKVIVSPTTIQFNGCRVSPKAMEWLNHQYGNYIWGTESR
jgi:hypothetical protein